MSGVGKKSRPQAPMPVVIYQGPPGSQNPLVSSPSIVGAPSTGNSPTPGKETIAPDAYLVF